MKVLIVDDEQHIVEYLKYVVSWKSLGFETVQTTSSSSAAREYLLAEKPELMITDIRMPEFSGLDLAEMVYKEGLTTKIIILSGYSDFSYAQKAIHYGTIDYLLKPITKNDLLPVIDRVKASWQDDLRKTELPLESSSETAPENDLIRSNELDEATRLAMVKIITYIREHYPEDITLDVLSEQVYMHPVTISRLFKTATGITVTEFISQIRLEAAADLLEHSNLLVSDIGNLVGYHKAQYFINLFKKQYGTTPQKYRRKMRLEGVES